MSENPDDEVSQLLHEWGLSDLKAKFKANYIVLQAFEYLTEEDIIELIPKIGQRAIFRGRLTKWRQQNGISPSPPLKLCKVELISDTKTEQEPHKEDPPKQEPQTKNVPSKSSQNDQPEETHISSIREPSKKSPPKINHKVYGTLTKCIQKGKKRVEPKPTMQSKVQQFYISPPVLDTSSPATPTPNLLRPILPKADLTPFVTSIIRVETNCDKTYAKTSPSTPETKVNRTTILQRVNNSQRNTSGSIQDIQDTPDAEEQLPEGSPLYPIVKLETEMVDTNWNEYTKLKLEPETEPELEPEPQPDTDDTANKDEDELLVESSAFQPECIETLDSDSVIGFDSENDNTAFSLKRIAPEVFRPRKKKRKVLVKLDIRNILMNSDMGRHVLNYYEANERLDLGRRRMLIDAIIQDCWIKNRRISPTNCKVIAEEIIEILPNERVEDYYIAQAGRNPKSPLYNKYRNMHKRFFLHAPVRKKKKKSLPQLTLEADDIEIDDDVIIS